MSGVEVGGPDVRSVVTELVRHVRPDIVLNAVGALKPVGGTLDPVAAVRLNSLLPRELAAACTEAGARLLTVSTDCVFSGATGGYTEDSIPDASDIYGRSKLLGEVPEPHLTIRTSIIGRELSGSRGLVEWFLGNRGGQVDGYPGAVFSGLPTVHLAGLMLQVAERWVDLAGVYHVSAGPIDKLTLLQTIRDAFAADVEIRPNNAFTIDRSLRSERFTEATGYRAPPWPDLIAVMAADAATHDYDRLRASTVEQGSPS